MAVIQGYRFEVSLDNRQFDRAMSAMKAQARELKSVMKANFTVLQNGEGSMAAFARRTKDAQATIDAYKDAIERLNVANRRNLEELKTHEGSSNRLNAAIARNTNTIASYTRQIELLKKQQREDVYQVQRARTGVDELRKATENITQATKTYTQSLSANGRFYASERARIEGLKATRQSLTSQLSAETKVYDLLKNKNKELVNQEKREIATLDSNVAKRKELKSQLTLLTNKYGENSEQAKKTRAEIERYNAAIEKSENKLQGYSSDIAKGNSQLSNQAEKLRIVNGQLDKTNKNLSGMKATKLGSITNSFKSFNASVKDSYSNTRKYWDSLKTGFATVSIAAAGAGAGILKAGSDYAKVQKQYIEVRNLLKTGGESAAQSIRTMNKMQREGVILSQKYGYSQKEIGDQYEELVKKGYSGSAALGSMNSMLKAARASGDDFADVVKVTSQAVDAFGLRVTHGANQAQRMAKNTNRVANAMASAADRTSTRFKDLGYAMGYVSSSAKTIGWDVEQTSAAIGVLTNRGLEGTRAGTGLRKVITSLVKPTKSAEGALRSVGLTIDDLRDKSGKLKSVDQIFSLINEHTKDMSKGEKGAFFNKLFGATGMAAGQILSEATKKTHGLHNELSDLIEDIHKDEKSNYINRLANANMKSGQAQIDRLKQSAKAFELTIGAYVLPAVNKVGNQLAKWTMSKEGRQSVKEFGKDIGRVMQGIANHTKDIIGFTSGLVQGFRDTAHVAGNVLSTVVKITDALHITNSRAGGVAKTIGRITGIVATAYITFKGIRTVGGLFLAVVKDTFGFTRKITDAVGITNSKAHNLTDTYAEQLAMAKEQLSIQKQITRQLEVQNSVDGGSGGGTSSGTPDIDLSPSEKNGTKTSRTAKAAEREGEAIGESAGKGYEKGFKGKVNRLNPKNWFNRNKAGSTAKELGSFAGDTFVGSAGKSIVNGKGKVKFSALFKYGTKAAEQAGTTTSMGFMRKMAAGIGNVRFKFSGGIRKLFGLAPKEAELAGAKSGTSFIGKLGGGIAKGANVLAGAWDIASAGINIVKGIREHNPEQKTRDLGSGIGTILGGGIAAAFLGPEAAPIGAAIGGAIGHAVPDVINAAKKLAHAFVEAWNKGVSGLQSSINNIMKHGWDGVKKNWNDFWGGMGTWFDKTFNVNGKGTTTHTVKHKKTTISDRVINTGVHIKKQDVANVKAMTSALKSYASSLKSAQAQIKKYDVSKELNNVNKFLNAHTKSWEKAAKPIKAIGDAFKYLSKFASSVAKKDAFAAFNKDLPKLDSVLKSHGKSIQSGIKKITQALKGDKKTGSLTSQFSKLAGSLNNITGKFKTMNKQLDDTAKDMKTLNSVFKQFAGKKNPLQNMSKGFDTLRETLKKDTKSITGYLKSLSSSFKGSKGLLSPLKKVTSNLKSFATNVKKANSSAKALAKTVKSMASSFNKLNSKSSGIRSVVSSLNALDKASRKSKFGSKIASQAKIAAKAFTGKGNFGKSFKKLAESTIKEMKKFVKDYSGAWKKMFKNIEDQTERWSKKVSSIQQQFGKKFEQSFKSIGSSSEKIFNKFWRNMQTAAGRGLNKVLSILNSGISKVNGVVRQFGGSGSIRSVGYVHYATGTGAFGNTRRPITKPTFAIVNDGTDSPETGNQEAWYNPNTGDMGVFKGRNVPTILPAGLEVFNAKETASLGLSDVKPQRFASGTGALKQLYELAKKYWKNPTGTLNSMFSSIGNGISGVMKSISNGMEKVAQDSASSYWSTLWNMAKDKVEDGGSGDSDLLKAMQKYGSGKPYVWGASGPNAFDCSGLVMYALKHAFGISFPHFSGSQYSMTEHISRANAKPGDLVFWGRGGSEHVGVYAGGNKYYSAQSPSQGIGMNTLSSVVGEGAPLFGRVRGMKRKSDDKEPKIKANSSLERFVKNSVGSGFWKTIEKIADEFGDANMPNVSGGAKAWTSYIKKAARQMHVSLTSGDLAQILSVIQGESNGSAKAINNWDSNARAGTPTKGILQYLDSTFLKYAMPGHKNIWNGYDQLLALFNDATWRRDLTRGGWGPIGARRFANGGFASEPSIFGEAGLEVAIPLSKDKRPRAMELLAQTVAMLQGEGSSSPQAQEAAKFEQEMMKKFNSFMDRVINLLDSDRYISTTIEADGQKLANVVQKHTKREQRRQVLYQERGFSNGI